MASIYQNSFLTVAATKSRDSEGGFFSDIDEGKCIKGRSARNSQETLFEVIVRLSPPVWDDGDAYPLLTRVWVFQERLLSPRVVHFASDELVWECMQEHTCQCKTSCHFSGGLADPFPLKAAYTERLMTNPIDLQKKWYDLASVYNQLLLSFEKDRLPAIAGAAQQIETYRGVDHDYLAGLWRSTLAGDLLWITEKSRISPREIPNVPFARVEPRAPTWSWASIRATIDWDTFVRASCDDPQGSNTSHCTPAGTYLFALIKSVERKELF
ncbi:hypothetical protein H2201_000842 [Coniosporium apollinis]|uniref:Heterokaryon incompatibility domain-containing protein n=1 Tax=Coniosporium apollinis TaxID=61459 RepID=A0ABQ9P341_9PEZI|nr:hypothetical protein H2201_000842 [Coniosporium apollinis]